MKTKMDLDLMTVMRYIDSSWLPSHFEICRKVLDGYERKYPLDIYGIAHLRLVLEDVITGECK